MSLPQDWADCISRVRAAEHLDEHTAQEAIRAIEYFKEQLSHDGKDLNLKEHPLYNLLVLNSPPHLHYVPWLANKVRSLISHVGTDTLLPKLRNPQEFWPTVAEVETAARLRRAGCTFDVEPEAKTTFGKKVPDFRMHGVNGFSCGYVEVKHKRPSIHKRRQRATARGLIPPSPPYWGVVYQELSPSRVRQLNNRIRALAKKMQTTGEIQELHDRNVIHLVFGPEEKAHQIKRQAEKRELKPNRLYGPPSNGDEVGRVKASIKKKSEQLPRAYPGIIAIKNPAIFQGPQSICAALVEIQDEIERIENLVFVIIHGVDPRATSLK